MAQRSANALAANADRDKFVEARTNRRDCGLLREIAQREFRGHKESFETTQAHLHQTIEFLSNTDPSPFNIYHTTAINLRKIADHRAEKFQRYETMHNEIVDALRRKQQGFKMVEASLGSQRNLRQIKSKPMSAIRLRSLLERVKRDLGHPATSTG